MLLCEMWQAKRWKFNKLLLRLWEKEYVADKRCEFGKEEMSAGKRCEWKIDEMSVEQKRLAESEVAS